MGSKLNDCPAVDCRKAATPYFCKKHYKVLPHWVREAVRYLPAHRTAFMAFGVNLIAFAEKKINFAQATAFNMFQLATNPADITIRDSVLTDWQIAILERVPLLPKSSDLAVEQKTQAEKAQVVPEAAGGEAYEPKNAEQAAADADGTREDPVAWNVPNEETQAALREADEWSWAPCSGCGAPDGSGSELCNCLDMAAERWLAPRSPCSGCGAPDGSGSELCNCTGDE